MSEKNKNKEASVATEKPMSKEEVLKAAQSLLKMAKDEPAKFAELTKAMAAPAPAAAPMAKPAAPKMPAPAAPKMPAPAAHMAGAAPAAKPAGGPMRMTKEAIMEDLKKPWAPKHMKKEGY
jgi:hypothetical protein